jgi:hypothetical protein
MVWGRDDHIHTCRVLRHPPAEGHLRLRTGSVQHSAQERCLACADVLEGSRQVPVEVRALVIDRVGVDEPWRSAKLIKGETPPGGSGDAAAGRERDAVEIDDFHARSISSVDSEVPEGDQPSKWSDADERAQKLLQHLVRGEDRSESRYSRHSFTTSGSSAEADSPASDVDADATVTRATHDKANVGFGGWGCRQSTDRSKFSVLAGESFNQRSLMKTRDPAVTACRYTKMDRGREHVEPQEQGRE